MNKLVCVLILFLVSCTPGTRYSLSGANDALVPTPSDDDLSNAIRISAEVPDKSGSTVYSIAHLIYTPADKQTADPIPDERPYAAWLYGAADFKYRKTETVQDTFGISIGIVGPHAQGEWVQNNFHDLIGDKRALGWDNQIGTEVGIILKLDRAYAVPLTKHFDLINNVGAHLGNIFTQAYAGTILRAGYNLPDFFNSPDPIFPRLPRERDNPMLSIYGFGGITGRAVLRNIFLDGNTFRDSQSVNKYPATAEGRLGFAVEYGLYRFSYCYFLALREYKEEDHLNPFGEISFSIGW